jgi:squalene-associated FAD-dependent desaturase
MSGSSVGGAGTSVAVIGGGLAGLAAAVAARQHGLAVALFEARPTLGGRARSFRDPRSGDWIDHGQHVSMGCCTNLAAFCRATGMADAFHRHRRLHFISPAGTRHDFSPARWLPAPLHLLPGLMRLRYLPLKDRLRIAAGMVRLAGRSGTDATDSLAIGPWLRAQRQSEQAIAEFWSVVLVSALSETIDRASLSAARKVFLDGFLASSAAHELLVPAAPLSELFDRRVGAWLEARGVEVHRRARVRQIEGDLRGAQSLLLADGSRRTFDFFVSAVPWRRVARLLAEPLLRAVPGLAQLERILPAPVTAVHLWLDRPLTPLPHAVLVGRLGQWLFNHGPRPLASDPTQTGPPTTPLSPRGRGVGGEGACHYVQVVISASHALKGQRREEITDRVWAELEAIWPEARHARLLHWRVVTEPEAVFSIRPGLDRLRPPQPTPVANLMLAGDWTATGWPATMEGAVRSGFLAAGAILRTLGIDRAAVAPDLPRGWLARWLFPRSGMGETADGRGSAKMTGAGKRLAESVSLLQ